MGDGLADLASAVVDGAAGDDVEDRAVAAQVTPPVASVGTDVEPAPPLRDILRRWGWKPLALLFSLNVLDELDRYAVVTLAPDIRDDLGLSNAAMGGLAALGAVVVVTIGLPFGVLADRGTRRPTIAGAAAMLWGGVVFLTSLVQNAFHLAGVTLMSGLGKATVEPVHGSLIADYYPAEARGRVYGVHQSANAVGAAFGPLLAGGIAFVAGWRWVFVIIAIPSVLAGLAALRLPEPGRGRHEREAADVEVDADDDGALAARVPLMTAVRRLVAIRTLRYLYGGIGLLGFGLISGPTLLSVYFDEQWGVGELGRAAIFSIIAIGSAVGVSLGGSMSDRLFRHDPAWPVFLIGGALVLYSCVQAIAVWLPALVLVVAVLLVATIGVGAATVSIRQIVAAVSPPAFRSLAFAMLGVYIALYGGFLGGIIFGAIADASSPRLALTLLAIPGILAGALMALGSRTVKDDIADVIADVGRAEIARATRRSSNGGALVEVRGVDFSYGPVQVLFDVDLDIPEGEITALLGTNGAGKSTVLRLITGLSHPSRGVIRYDGQDVTYLEAEQLLGLGIAQMPGGKAVFPSLSIQENLRVGAYTFRKDTARVEREIKQVEEWFPVLGQRRDQPASTLSGGEQQMLALGKAFLTSPRLLCIDELSLGLAPSVVGSLLDIVRTMHARGTTIVLVEQSLNVALSLADTAIFMEKGQVRFTGAAAELLERPDLARSVFLEGAAR
jgi:ABC-type branched-subunit amino acid transport system ATPase component/predicted MFS family arabinose efflux permease